MKNIKVVRPLKSSQTVREEAAQPMLQQSSSKWKPPVRSGWTSLPPEAAMIPGPEPATVPTAPVAYSEPETSEASTTTNKRRKYLTGSELAVRKLPLPKGAYIVVVLTATSLVVNLFRSADNSAVFTIVLFLNLLAAVGLLLQLEFFRKVLVLLAVTVLVLAGMNLFEQEGVHISLLFTAIVSAGQIVYVTRPKVRAAFETLKT